MRLGIDPTVDFAFKLMLGNPEHPDVTIHFLNAVLQLSAPVTSVEILNPIQGKDRPEDKLVILDILARDSLGRCFNVEMQTTRQVDLPRRLLYYSSLSYARQIGVGDNYTELRTVFSICVLDEVLFTPAEFPRYHHSFRLRCDQVNLVLTNDFEFHTLELPKFVASSNNIGSFSTVEKWLYLFKNAESMDSQQLSSMLTEPPYQEAIGVLEMISKSPDDLQFYEARLKFLRDQHSHFEAARLEGKAEGKSEGLAEGIERGRSQGIVEGTDKGVLSGKIQLLQEILGELPATLEQLQAMDSAALKSMLYELQKRMDGGRE